MTTHDISPWVIYLSRCHFFSVTVVVTRRGTRSPGWHWCYLTRTVLREEHGPLCPIDRMLSLEHWALGNAIAKPCAVVIAFDHHTREGGRCLDHLQRLDMYNLCNLVSFARETKNPLALNGHVCFVDAIWLQQGPHLLHSTQGFLLGAPTRGSLCWQECDWVGWGRRKGVRL
ncbi:hypothetical protein BGW80DRAFT_235092 [Lactifluus volemus]|nr:hypothetical protein BGW80DRAFT_235092 [Lactifluus volemus]